MNCVLLGYILNCMLYLTICQNNISVITLEAFCSPLCALGSLGCRRLCVHFKIFSLIRTFKDSAARAGQYDISIS